MQNRSEFLKLRVQPAEKAALEAMASAQLSRPSEVVRDLIRREAAQRGLWPPQPQPHGGRPAAE